MPRYRIDTVQDFSVSYHVEAETEDEAWEKLLEGNQSEPLEQIPGDITGEEDQTEIYLD